WTHRKYGLHVLLSCDPLADPTRKDVRTLLFESVRELLLNVVKHTHVNQVRVDLQCYPEDMLSVSVEDEGIGFNPVVNRSTTSGPGWGLFSIRERLALLGGRFEIDSMPGRGTRCRLIAPKGDVSAAMHSPVAPLRPANPPASRPGVASTRALRILIADDH